MWLQDATKQDLLSIFQSDSLSNRSLRNLRSLQDLTKDLPEDPCELQFLWREDPREMGNLPSVIIIDKNIQRDFLAWSATYLPYCRPLTALCRVASRETLQIFNDFQLPIGLGRLETICIGLIIGEAASYIAGQSSVNRLSIPAFLSTYSFVIARAIAENMLPSKQEELGELWANARRLTGQRSTNLTLNELNQVWRLVANIIQHKSLEKWSSEGNFGIVEIACREILDAGEISENIWYMLTDRLVENNITFELFKGPREGRVLHIERILSSLCQQSLVDKMTLSFIGGYLVSRIAPGNFDHTELLLPYLNKLPTLLLWYGLCTGLSSDSKLQNFGNGIGRRIIREAVQEDTILNRPRCDIALKELEVLSSGKDPVQNLQIKESGHLVVEILPCVNSTMRNPEKIFDNGLSQTQHSINQGSRDRLLQALLKDLDRSLNSVEKIRNDIGEIIGYSEQRKEPIKKGKNKY